MLHKHLEKLQMRFEGAAKTRQGCCKDALRVLNERVDALSWCYRSIFVRYKGDLKVLQKPAEGAVKAL